MPSFEFESEEPYPISHVVLGEICNVLSKSKYDINLDSSFICLGGDSHGAIKVVSGCRSRNVRISVESILGRKSLSEILSCSEPISNQPNVSQKRTTKIARTHTVESCQPSTLLKAVCPTPSTTAGIKTPMTEMQASPIHGNQNHPGTHVISFFETYRSQDVPAMRQAWKEVINSEQIFRTSFDLIDGGADLVSEISVPFVWEEVVVDTGDAYETAVEEDQYPSRIGTHFRVVTYLEN